MSDPFELPMFPLGSVLLPGEVLPLHVFEPRYRTMIGHCLTAVAAQYGAASFGVVLIERGHEVGGGDQRFDVGVAATILRVEDTPQGTLRVLAIGTRRLRVAAWLDDAPFPRASVSWWDDEDAEVGESPGADQLQAFAQRVRRVRAAAIELGDIPGHAAAALSDDSQQWEAEIPSLLPIGSLDRYRLLSAPSSKLRWQLVDELLSEIELVQGLRL